MFGFGKKEQKKLFIRAKDVFAIIKADYAAGAAFCLIDFKLDDQCYTMGAALMPNSEEAKENIFFVFEHTRYDTYEAFAEGAQIGGVKLADSSVVLEVLRAGIVDGEPLLKTPWGDTRLAKMAIQG